VTAVRVLGLGARLAMLVGRLGVALRQWFALCQEEQCRLGLRMCSKCRDKARKEKTT
jgi:hypothetical protein